MFVVKSASPIQDLGWCGRHAQNSEPLQSTFTQGYPNAIKVQTSVPSSWEEGAHGKVEEAPPSERFEPLQWFPGRLQEEKLKQC